MYSYKITFKTLKNILVFEMKSRKKHNIEKFRDDVLSMFVELNKDGKPIIESLQRNTIEIRDKLNLLSIRYSSEVPELKGVAAFLRKLEEGESFFFIPEITLDDSENLRTHNHLRAIAENKSFEEVEKQMNELFGELLKKYQVAAFGEHRFYIGNKYNRVCRFCNNKRENITFNNKSHAISEALGNKNLILLDECDACNYNFSETIEPDIVRYLAFFRTVYNVKGKGGSKKIQGKNFNLENNGNVDLTIKNAEDLPENHKRPYSLRLETKDIIISQNIYKCLCKYFLSVINSEYLEYFQKTIDWINGKIQIDNLPKVRETISYSTFTIQPKLITYIRKDEDMNYPFAIGEFHFTCKIFVFIIPLCNKDEKDFTVEDNCKDYLHVFQHHKKMKGWSSIDYSNRSPKQVFIDLKEDRNFNC